VTLTTRLALTCAVLWVCAPGPRAASQAIEEGHAKAAFLFNFARFVQWPASASPLRIGVVGDDHVAELLEAMVRDRQISGRTLQVRALRHGDDPAGCDMLYITPSRQREDVEMLRRIHGPVLTIGETVQFLRDGGMVRLFRDDDRVRFQINAQAATDAGLKVHSQLLSLAAQ
jgi:hypothetical protein